jgi:hypothetical protein
MTKLKAAAAAVESRLIDDWRTEIKRLWSIRVQIISAAVAGLYAAWPAFQDKLPPGKFAAAMVALGVAGVLLRLLKQRRVAAGEEMDLGGDDA